MEDGGNTTGVHTAEAGSQGPQGPMGTVSILYLCEILLIFSVILIPDQLAIFLSLTPSLSLCSNEAWRYSGGFARAVTLSDVLLRGFKWGFAAFTVALAVEYALFPPKKGGH